MRAELSPAIGLVFMTIATAVFLAGALNVRDVAAVFAKLTARLPYRGVFSADRFAKGMTPRNVMGPFVGGAALGALLIPVFAARVSSHQPVVLAVGCLAVSCGVAVASRLLLDARRARVQGRRSRARALIWSCVLSAVVAICGGVAAATVQWG